MAKLQAKAQKMIMKEKLLEAEATAARAQSVRKRMIGAKAKISALNAFRRQVDEIEGSQ